MKTPMRKTALALLLGTTLTTTLLPLTGRATGIPVVDAASIAQAIQQLTQLKTQYDQLVRQYSTQLEQFDLQKINSRLPGHYLWDDVQSTIQDLNDSIDTINYYQQQFGDLQNALKQIQDLEYYQSATCINGVGCSESQTADLREHRQKLSSSIRNSYTGLMHSIKLQQENLATDARRVQELQEGAESAEGTLQALQYANMIAAEQAHQMLEMRALMIAQQAMQASQVASDLDTTSHGDAIKDQVMTWQAETSPEDNF